MIFSKHYIARHCEEQCVSPVSRPEAASGLFGRATKQSHSKHVSPEIASSSRFASLSRLLAMTVVYCLSSFVSSAQYTQYVNPFIGTGGHGHTFPGAVVPFGMAALSPDTRIDGSWDGCSGYHYSDSIIYGFSHTHLSGTGCSDLGDIMLMPTSQTTTDKNIYSSKFSHKFESAKAGMYDVYLSDDKINVSLTATIRCGFHEYKWNNTAERKIVLDLRHRDELLDGEIEIVSPTKIEGYRRSKAWAKDQWCFYSIEFSEPIKLLYNADGTELKPEVGTKLTGKNVAACFVFSTGTQMMVKVGISGTDKQGARKNLQAEIPHWDFQTTYKQADSLWNKELSCIEVDNISQRGSVAPPSPPGEGPGERYTIFYTALYHCFIHPSINNDVDHRYRGRDGKIHIADSFDYYTVFSLWDTYRALHPLFNIVQRKRNLDFIKTFLAHYDQVGRLPIWELWGNETDCMIGYHAVSVIADAYNKGIRDFDVEKAYKAMTSIANSNWRGLDIYRKKGYLEVEDESESVSKTLEYSYDDWCIRAFRIEASELLLQKLGKKKFPIYQLDSIRWDLKYRNLFNPSSKCFRAKSNGGWNRLGSFSPYEINNDYTEANAWQYSFSVPHDIKGLIRMMGGEETFEKQLDELFTTSSNTIGRRQPDVSGMIGQYAHGNEPSHHIAYLYNEIGKPWKTQMIVQQILDDFYKNSPDGLIGNDDCGQMSAWYVWSSIGLYPTCPGNDLYSVSSPVFKNIKVFNKDNCLFNIMTIGEGQFIKDFKESNHKTTLKTWDFDNPKYKTDLVYEMDKVPLLNYDNFYSWKPYYRESEFIYPPNISINSCYKPKICFSIDHKQHLNLNNITYTSNIKPRLDRLKYKVKYRINDSEIRECKECNFQTDSLIVVSAWTVAYDTLTNIEWFPASDTAMALINKNPYNWEVHLNSIPHPEYTAGGKEALIDGLLGSTEWRKGRWIGVQGKDFECSINFDSYKRISEISANFLQDVQPWIFMPKEIIFYVSDDYLNFREVGKVYNDVSDTVLDCTIKKFTYKFSEIINVRAIKIKATNYGKLPQWHVSHGEPAYIFVDEVWVK